MHRVVGGHPLQRRVDAHPVASARLVEHGAARHQPGAGETGQAHGRGEGRLGVAEEGREHRLHVGARALVLVAGEEQHAALAQGAHHRADAAAAREDGAAEAAAARRQHPLQQRVAHAVGEGHHRYLGRQGDAAHVHPQGVQGEQDHRLPRRQQRLHLLQPLELHPPQETAPAGPPEETELQVAAPQITGEALQQPLAPGGVALAETPLDVEAGDEVALAVVTQHPPAQTGAEAVAPTLRQPTQQIDQAEGAPQRPVARMEQARGQRRRITGRRGGGQRSSLSSWSIMRSAWPP